MSNEQNNDFHLGLTMAGAVSAGCYTSGVMDYLFEALNLWEKAKNGGVEGIDKSLVPQHNVIIDAMGGCSAGGMSTMISTLYALQGDIQPVKEIPDDPLSSQNILYNSWVHLDDGNESTFKKLWDTDDLEKDFISLFNSKVIDAIASKVLTQGNGQTNIEDQIKNHLPKFISKDLEIILSHTLLSGISLAVDFKTEIARKLKTSPKHNTFEHYMVSHYKLNAGLAVNEDSYLWFNPYEKKYLDKIILSTIATGAFPLGLAYREFDNNQFSDEYIKSVTKRVIYGDFSEDNPDKDDNLELKGVNKFESLTVDGGAINNEPYREVGSILKKFHVDGSVYQNYGLIMIDPFPDNDDIKREYVKPKGLLKVIPKIIQTLWNQSKVKRKEMLEQYDAKFLKGVIYPVKYKFRNEKNVGKDKFPLASASFNAFGGFLDVNFRVHDFFLGRNNARNFIRYFGSFPYEPNSDPTKENIHPIHKSWTQEMVDKFVIEKDVKGEDGETVKRLFLPIIPDLNMILDGTNSKDDSYKYTYKEKPKYNPNRLFKLEKNILQRFRRILDLSVDEVGSNTKADKTDHPISEKWLSSVNKTSWFKRIGKTFGSKAVGLLRGPAKKEVAKMMSKWVISYILKDLEEMDILEKKK